MKERLDFSEFSPSTRDQWMRVLTKELGERPYDFLKWSPLEGLLLEPYYTHYNSIFNAVSTPEKDVMIAESFLLSRLDSSEPILRSLEQGVNHLTVVLDDNKDFRQITEGVFFEYIHTTLQLEEKNLHEGLKIVEQFIFANSSILRDYSFSVRIPLSSLQDVSLIRSLSSVLKSSKNKFKPFVIDTSNLGHFGMDVALQVSTALSAGRRTLDILIEEEKFTVDDALAAIGFHFATSTGYFQEMSKYIVFRTLWSTIAQSYDPEHTCSQHTQITTVSSLFTYSSIDAYNNMLRATSQCMSAYLGQADSIEVLGYDRIDQNSEQGKRWARNILHLLVEESHFKESRNAAEGAFFINQLNCELAEVAWSKFKEVEVQENSSFLMGILSLIKFQNDLQKQKYNRTEKSLVGVNKFPNKMEVLKNTPSNEFSFRAAFDMENKYVEEGRS